MTQVATLRSSKFRITHGFKKVDVSLQPFPINPYPILRTPRYTSLMAEGEQASIAQTTIIAIHEISKRTQCRIDNPAPFRFHPGETSFRVTRPLGAIFHRQDILR
jgi:hypothetical protein